MKLSLSFARSLRTLLLLAVSLFISFPVLAELTITSPNDNYATQTELCPNAPCHAFFGFPAPIPPDPDQPTHDDNPIFEIRAEGEPIDYLLLDFTESGVSSHSVTVCQPPDPIENIDGCHPLPFYFEQATLLKAGFYTVVARAIRGSQQEVSSAITIIVSDHGTANAGTISLSSVEPNSAAPALVLRDALPDNVTTDASTVRIIGENLHNNPFIRVFLAPIVPGEQSINTLDPLPVIDWCLYEATIKSRTEVNGQSVLWVELPELPLTTAVLCGLVSTGSTSIFNLQWRWVIQDDWLRPERTHAHYAIPSPRIGVPSYNAPPFRVIKPSYAKIDGFGFDNHSTDASYNEFLSVYGNNAYLCVGALGVCATRIPDPIYHTLWYGIYRLAIDHTGGSCNGLSATSLLFHHELLQTEDYESDVHFPYGFNTPGPDSQLAHDDDGNAYMEGVAKYKDSNFCTPFCSPPKPDNLWAEVRMNHGVQLSREFLKEIFKTLGQSLVDVGDLDILSDDELFQGIPNATLENVIANPTGNVLCFSEFGGGHCVAPYAVEGGDIHIYDNNNPGNAQRVITISGGDYHYPDRNNSPNEGNFIIAYPLDLWQNGRSLFGISDALEVDNLTETLDFLAMILSGSADMTITNDSGQRFGWEDDGSFSKGLPGVFTSNLMGPNDEPMRNGVFYVSEPASANATLSLNSDGGSYAFHTGSGGQLLQLETGHAQPGDKDQLTLQFSDGLANGYAFQPQRRSDRLVLRTGLAMGVQDSAVFSYLGLNVIGGDRVAVSADKQLRENTLLNDGSEVLSYLLSLDYAAGETNRYGRMAYGPLELAAGARQSVRLHLWPDVSRAQVLTDIDNDGHYDDITEVIGQPLVQPEQPEVLADLSLTKLADREEAQVGDVVSYTLTLHNQSELDVPLVQVTDILSLQGQLHSVYSSQGSCSVNVQNLTCDLGVLMAGASAEVYYSLQVSAPGSLINQAVVSSAYNDPDWSNNSASVSVRIPVRLDIKPKSINLNSQGVIPMAVMGAPGFDVTAINVGSVHFGPMQASVDHPDARHYDDIDNDGYLDQVFHFSVQDSALDEQQVIACLSGSLNSGQSFTGCDAIQAK